MADTATLASLLSGSGTGYGGGSKKRRLAETLAMQAADTSPIQSPFQGLARLAQAWAAKDMMGTSGGEANAIADILAPSTYESGNSGQNVTGDIPGMGQISTPVPQITETSDPKRQAIISAITSGAVEPDAFNAAIVDKLGGGKPKDLIKLGSDDRLFDPNNNTQIVGAAPNPNKPFNPDGTPNEAYQQYEMEKAARGASRTNTNVTLNTDKAFGTQLGEGAAKSIDASAAAARGAVQTINMANMIRSAIASGKVMAGPTTTLKMAGAQLFGGDQNKLNETRKVIYGLANLALSARGQLKGQGQISDYEGKLLQKASSGDIDNLSLGEINTIADLADRAGRIAIQNNANLVAKARQVPGSSSMPDFYNVEMPAPYAPQTAAPQGGGRKILKYNPATGKLE